MKAKKILLLMAFLVLGLSLSFVSAIVPNGASISAGSAQTAPSDAAGQDGADAGNVTELTISGYATTQTWQGYFGNVSGVVQLADSNDKVMYNWTLVNPQGEVYASTNESLTWANIQCFNFTANGTDGGIAGETAGAYNKGGVNLTLLEAQYNIAIGDVDGVNETFTLTNHDAFYTANLEFAENECRSTRIYDSTGTGVDGNFEEVLLYEPATYSVVFTSLLESGSVNGFDGLDYDFEMLVLEDGHDSDVDATTYYFFVEIE